MLFVFATRDVRVFFILLPVRYLEHGMGFEPMYNGFAGRRVCHFAIRAHCVLSRRLTY